MKKGFTLVELIGIIIILGIVSYIAVLAINRQINGAKEKAYNVTIHELEEAAKNWNIKYGSSQAWTSYNNYEGFLLTIDTLKDSEFLDDVPIDPRDNSEIEGSIIILVDENGTYSYKYKKTYESVLDIRYEHVAEIINQSDRKYYVYFKRDNDPIEYLFLSDDFLYVMEQFSDDVSRRYVSLPCPYRPIASPIGEMYVYENNLWTKMKNNSNLRNDLLELNGTDAEIENINSWFDEFNYNYNIILYKNNTAGVISTYDTLIANPIKE